MLLLCLLFVNLLLHVNICVVYVKSNKRNYLLSSLYSKFIMMKCCQQNVNSAAVRVKSVQWLRACALKAMKVMLYDAVEQAPSADGWLNQFFFLLKFGVFFSLRVRGSNNMWIALYTGIYDKHNQRFPKSVNVSRFSLDSESSVAVWASAVLYYESVVNELSVFRSIRCWSHCRFLCSVWRVLLPVLWQRVVQNKHFLFRY